MVQHTRREGQHDTERGGGSRRSAGCTTPREYHTEEAEGVTALQRNAEAAARMQQILEEIPSQIRKRVKKYNQQEIIFYFITKFNFNYY